MAGRTCPAFQAARRAASRSGSLPAASSMDSITGIPGPFAAVRQPICRMARKHDAETVPGALWDAVGLCRGDCAASPCPRLPQSAVTSGTCFPLLKVCRPNLPGRSADRSDPRHGIPSSAPEKAARGLLPTSGFPRARRRTMVVRPRTMPRNMVRRLEGRTASDRCGSNAGR